jgi:glycosyltransferase involved in cell wall biosynthesis
MKRIHVLLSAYACEPSKGSEPYQGWMWALSLAKVCKVTVITRANNREAIEAALPSVPVDIRPQFLFYDPPSFLIVLKKAGLPISVFYLAWQLGIRRFITAKLQDFDVIHHVTFCSFALPGFWWFTKPVVVLGPLGGGMLAPWRMLGLLGPGLWREVFRTAAVCLASLNPALRQSFAKAAIIIAANADTKRIIPRCYADKTLSMVEIGVETPPVRTFQPPAKDKPLQLVWAGSMHPRKAAVLALEALANSLELGAKVVLHLVGDGEELPRLRRRAAELNLQGSVIWHGRLTHLQTRKQIGACDAFIFTSLRDTAGNVLLEAMASGLAGVVICHQGVSHITTDKTAFRVNPGNPRQVIQALADGIYMLSVNKDLCYRMGQAGQQRVVDRFVWEIKSMDMLAIYHKALKLPF